MILAWAVKYDTQGLFIYAAMCAYLLAYLLMLFRRERLGMDVYVVGFLVLAAGVGYRWRMVGHVPMQNLFEVFMCMGLVYPFTVFCRRFLQVGCVSVDMLLGVVILFPAGFVFESEPGMLPPALQCWLFGPHVLVYMMSYVIMAKAAVQAVCELGGARVTPGSGLVDYEQGTYRLVCLGFPLLTLGLVLGCWWAKLAWGRCWGWDPKELWSLASWLVYLGYFHFRAMFGRRYRRVNSVWAIVGLLFIVVTLLWVNLSRLFSGLHSYAT